MGRRLLPFSPIIVAFLAMLPRLLSAQFGLLDDGITLRLASIVYEHPLAGLSGVEDSGRFVPAYAWVFGVVYALGGARPVSFFVANFVVLGAITAALIAIVRLRGGTSLQAWAAGIFFVLSGAAVESFYTLSKAEPPQLVWVMLSMLLVGWSERARVRGHVAAVLLAATAALLLACATKETTVAMVPISLGWLIVARFAFASHNGRQAVIPARMLLVSAVACGAFFALRAGQGYHAFSQGSYTRLYRLQWENVRSSLGDWANLLARDFTYLIPLIAVVLALSFIRGQPQRPLLLDAAVWMIGWMAVYLPWGWTFEYYLLPFTVGAAAFGGVAFGQAVLVLREGGRRIARRVAAGGLGAFIIVWPMNLSNIATHAGVQLAVDAANADMLRFAATLPDTSVLRVNFPGPHEYVNEIKLHLTDLDRRPDIVVEYLDPSGAMLGLGPLVYYVAAPRMTNQISPTVRLGFSEASATDWDRALALFVGDRREPVYSTLRHAQLFLFNLHRPGCWFRPSTGACARERRSFLDRRVFSYGWDVYRVQGNPYPHRAAQ